MTLDIFQKGMEALAVKFKTDMQELLTKAVEANLDEEIVIRIVQREMEKMGND